MHVVTLVGHDKGKVRRIPCLHVGPEPVGAVKILDLVENAQSYDSSLLDVLKIGEGVLLSCIEFLNGTRKEYSARRQLFRSK